MLKHFELKCRSSSTPELFSSCCAICTGRSHVIQTLDAEAQSLPERLAILDPSFHPVLSFPHDIPVNAQLEAVLKSGKVRPSVKPRTSIVEKSAASTIDTGAAIVDGLQVSSNASPFATASSTTCAPSKVSSSSVSSFGGLLSSKERKREKSLAKKKTKLASAAPALGSVGDRKDEVGIEPEAALGGMPPAEAEEAQGR